MAKCWIYFLVLFMSVSVLTGCKTNQTASSDGVELIFGDDGFIDNDYTQPDSTITLEDITADSLVNEAENKIKSLIYDEAITDLDQAIALKPTNADAYFFRALAKSYLQNYTGSVQDADKAIALDPDYMSGYYIRANSYASLKEYEKAEADYNHLIKERPGDFSSVYMRGTMYLDSGNYNAAISDFNTYINGNKNITGITECGDCYLSRAQAHYIAGNLKQACADWQAAVNLGNKKAAGALKKNCK
ncbi:tetratricopeptide repeat protein [Pontibacter pudoricolor]|uniref:tetratricopeptide repeat protein n=1 Tax=Pontibacter pudoricolor TaxID=2694930 RepID=UPI0013916A10|nr:tetratricopeptide repeat protein [Pontibacter pudoricolor]